MPPLPKILCFGNRGPMANLDHRELLAALSEYTERGRFRTNARPFADAWGKPVVDVQRALEELVESGELLVDRSKRGTYYRFARPPHLR